MNSSSGSKKPRVLILGATGMLGSMLLEVFDRAGGFALHATGREDDLIERASVLFPRVSWHPLLLSPFETNTQRLIPLPEVDWIINAINVTKPYIGRESPTDRERALQINGMFPHELSRYATSRNTRVIQMTTDWVFSGARGGYTETDNHDAHDVYGKTMSLGEVVMPHTYILRAALVGPEPRGTMYLYEWLRALPHGAKLQASTHTVFNGVTTLHFARICFGLVSADIRCSGVQHIVPRGSSSEFELINAICASLNRHDILVEPTETPVLNRTLATKNMEQNARLWAKAGYADRFPSFAEMIEELAQFSYRFR